MIHEETVMELMNQLVIADKHTIGDLLAHKKIYPQEGVSKVNNAYKILNTLVDSGKLERGNKYFRIPGNKSTYQDHAQFLTHALAEIIKLNYVTKILREPTLEEVGLRPDAIVFLNDGTRGLCFVLEICRKEKFSYAQMKLHVWGEWAEANAKLSELFQTLIKKIDIVVSGDEIPDGAFEFKSYLEEVKK